jgi:hypothetical protein
MQFRNEIIAHAKAAGLDPVYVVGEAGEGQEQYGPQRGGAG